MGSSGLVTEQEKESVESTSLSSFFEKACPIYMSFGMSYDDFWYGDVYMTQFYKEKHKIVLQQNDENNWMIGMYVYEAVLDCSPVLHAFSKTGTKPLPYSDKPYLAKHFETKTEAQKQQELENDRLIAMVHFNNWFRATKKQFEKKKE